ncbi:hypothetical protein M407DRAFT_10820 [Tulasnella calospora MUT 4182]|uniref:Uncharacterized protein n=1 Tax=Tulasnella calospora MUT 4182 TaxID=1051891 RepID=A0A0C3LGF3_9AGAM|nr:hypothetical protein M407DRAFT_10820 [Tulasnella calospora MUT 4182]
MASNWSHLESGVLTIPYAVDIIRILQDSGIELKSAVLTNWNGKVPEDLLRGLNLFTRLVLETTSELPWKVIDQLGRSFLEDLEASDGYLQFLCPSLTTLDLKVSVPGLYIRGSFHSQLRRMIRNRQTGTHPTNGPAKLQKVGLPSILLEEHDHKDAVFEGIEMYSTD